MIGSTFLAYIAGLVTILNPCVLPLIPILIASALGKGKFGPVALAAGMVTSFTIFGFIIIAFGFSLGINEQSVRIFAGALLLLAGALLLLPRAQAALSTAAAPITNLGNRALGNVNGEGMLGQYMIGALLGLVWAPCVGPTLGVAIAAASQGENLASAFFTFFVFGLGVATSILLFAYGSRKALGERSKTMQSISRYAKPIFGVSLLLVGAMVITGFDKVIEIALLEILPEWLIAFTVQF